MLAYADVQLATHCGHAGTGSRRVQVEYQARCIQFLSIRGTSVPGFDFKAKDGRVYTISIDGEGESIEVVREGEKLGHITLEYRCDWPIEPEHYYINDLAFDKCKGKGIGEAALNYHRECFGLPILAAKERGPKNNDGSHLIDDGVLFIRRMRENGIVCPEPEERE